ncbi:MAG: methyltransferase [archaeon]|nr:methyltransferase [archaeon]
MVFTKIQERQVRKQLKRHNRPSGEREIILGKGKKLKLFIQRGVFGSDIMSSGMHLARFLFENQKLYKNKVVLDMGCGPGTQGLVMAKFGAKSTNLADISSVAIQNAKQNIQELRVRNAKAIESDLFSKIPNKRYDVIVFNQPYFSGNHQKFSGDPNRDPNLRKSMLGGTKLIHKFLKQVPNFLKKDGILIMSYFHFAGPENNPTNHVAKYGFKIIKEDNFNSRKGLQKGNMSIYVFFKK